MRRWNILIMLMMFIPLVQAGICEERIDEFVNCTVVTPNIDCTTYTFEVFNVTNGTLVVDGTMNLLNNSVYWFEFNQSEGEYMIVLCDNTTAQLRVTETLEAYIGGSYMEIAIAIFFSIVLLFFIAGTIYSHRAAREVEGTKQVKYYVLTAIFFYGSWGIVLLIINTMRLIAEDNSATADTVSMINSAYLAAMWFLLFLAFMGAVYGLYRLLAYAADVKHAKGKQADVEEF